jgi:hypothetical protein
MKNSSATLSHHGSCLMKHGLTILTLMFTKMTYFSQLLYSILQIDADNLHTRMSCTWVYNPPLSLCVDWFRSNHWLASPSLQVQYKEALVHVPSATLFNRRHIFAASPCSLLLLTVGSEVLIKSFPVFVFFWMDVTWTKMSYWCSPSCSDLGAALIQTKDSFLIISLLFRTAGAITLTSDSQFFKWKMPNCTAIRCLSTCTYAQVNLSTNMIFA